MRIDPSEPAGDAPCPQCGHLLWFDQSDLRRRVLESLARRFSRDPDAIDLDAPLSDLGGDSLDVVELVMDLEEEFETNIPDDASHQMRTIRDLIEWIIRARFHDRGED